MLLGHTLDDQAEQVLLGLTRGSGARSLAGMPRARGRFRRPLLGVSREQTRASCAAEGLTWWDDPMNEDPAFTRVRARRALVDLERDLGPGVAAALARTADQLREDADHLDGSPRPRWLHLGAEPWAVDDLLALPRAVRTRVWRRLAVAAGCAGRAGEHPAHRGVRRAAHALARAGTGQPARRPAGDPHRRAGIHRRLASG